MDFVLDHNNQGPQKGYGYPQPPFPGQQPNYMAGPPNPYNPYPQPMPPSAKQKKGMGGGAVFFLSVLAFILGFVASIVFQQLKAKAGKVIKMNPGKKSDPPQPKTIYQQHQEFRDAAIKNMNGEEVDLDKLGAGDQIDNDEPEED
jgi:hypothetical protein